MHVLYFWKYKSLAQVGHVSLRVHRPGFQDRYISFWPESTTKVTNNPRGSLNFKGKWNTFEDDVSAEGGVDVKPQIINIPADILDGTKIQNWLEKVQTDPSAKYNLLKSNCAHVVSRAIQSGLTAKFQKWLPRFDYTLLKEPYQVYEKMRIIVWLNQMTMTSRVKNLDSTHSVSVSIESNHERDRSLMLEFVMEFVNQVESLISKGDEDQFWKKKWDAFKSSRNYSPRILKWFKQIMSKQRKEQEGETKIHESNYWTCFLVQISYEYFDIFEPSLLQNGIDRRNGKGRTYRGQYVANWLAYYFVSRALSHTQDRSEDCLWKCLAEKLIVDPFPNEFESNYLNLTNMELSSIPAFQIRTGDKIWIRKEAQISTCTLFRRPTPTEWADFLDSNSREDYKNYLDVTQKVLEFESIPVEYLKKTTQLEMENDLSYLIEQIELFVTQSQGEVSKIRLKKRIALIRRDDLIGTPVAYGGDYRETPFYPPHPPLNFVPCTSTAEALVTKLIDTETTQDPLQRIAILFGEQEEQWWTVLDHAKVYKKKYNDIFCLDASSLETLTKDIKKLSTYCLGIPIHDRKITDPYPMPATNAHFLFEATYQYLSDQEKKSLFIFKNAETNRDDYFGVFPFLPHSKLEHQPAIVVLCPNPVIWPVVDQEYTQIPPGTYNESDILKYFKLIFTKSSDLKLQKKLESTKIKIKELEVLVHGIPLAIRLCGAWINQNYNEDKFGVGLQEYIKLFQEKMSRLTKVPELRHIINIGIEIAINQCFVNEKQAGTMVLLQKIAQAQDALTGKDLIQMIQELELSESISVETEEEDNEEIILQLERYGLIYNDAVDTDVPVSESSFQMHPILKQVLSVE